MADIKIQEPNDLPEGYITEETAARLALVVYSQESTSGGIKRIGFLPWKSFLDYDSSRAKNIAKLIGFTVEEYDKQGAIIPDPSVTLRDQLKAVADQTGVEVNPVVVEKTIKARVESLETTVGGSSTGLVKDVNTLKTTVGDKDSGLVKDVIELQNEITGGGGGVGEGIITRIVNLETTVGDKDDGLVKDVTTLKTTVGDNDKGLVKDFNTLKDTVGDSTKGIIKDVDSLRTTVGNSSSGLVKDINDLKTTVGDATSGLVKDFNTLKTTVGDKDDGLVKQVTTNTDDIKTLQEVVGDEDGGLVKQVTTNTDDIATLKSSVSSAYKFQGDIASNNDYILKKKELQDLGEEANGYVYNLTVDITDGELHFNVGSNIAWVYKESGSYFDELGSTVADSRIGTMYSDLYGDTGDNGIKNDVEVLVKKFSSEQSSASPRWKSSNLISGTYLITCTSSKGAFVGILTKSDSAPTSVAIVSGTITDFLSVDESQVYSLLAYTTIGIIKVA